MKQGLGLDLSPSDQGQIIFFLLQLPPGIFTFSEEIDWQAETDPDG